MTHEKQERIQGQGGATQGPWEATPRREIDPGTGEAHRFESSLRVVSEKPPRKRIAVLDFGYGSAADEANAKLIAAAPDHALLLAALVSGKAQWKPLDAFNGMGEVAIDGLRYTARLDEFGCPIVESGLRAALRKAGREP